MSSSPQNRYIEQAFLLSLDEGVVELVHDWKASRMPPIRIKDNHGVRMSLRSLPAEEYAAESRYFIDREGMAVFVFNPDRYPILDYENTRIFVAGSFNGWDQAIGDDEWRLRAERLGGEDRLVLRVSARAAGLKEDSLFKFVSEHHHWLPVDVAAPNIRADGSGNLNYRFSFKRTGRHRMSFRLSESLDLSDNNFLLYQARSNSQEIYLHPGGFFQELLSDKELGAVVDGSTTTFRLFAPRAKWVKVGHFDPELATEPLEWILLSKRDDYVWETRMDQNLVGHHYWFRLDGPSSAFGLFDPEFKVLDPYAKACVSREGPAVVIDDTRYEAMPPFQIPPWHDLVIVEAHARDLVVNTSQRSDEGPNGFAQLRDYAEQPDFYPAKLGVNAIELQPVQENDSPSYEAYHWGYMTANFFSPASSYASNPARASQVDEFREVVAAFHRRGLAVILDVVYNHVGEPAHLMFVDKLYYFHLTSEGNLSNWSGCGNDLNCDAPMARRILVESLKRLALFYGVDGFRFDLADLVGKKALQEVERELKAVKPGIILIAEPWSFRGHIGMELRDTGFASWNDGYREFLKKYVAGNGNQEGLKYFLRGSPEFYATWPAQTVNYVESHDDRAWIDEITEHADGNGTYPSLNDIHRSHLMIAILMMSIGLPMLHAGQDFLQSKDGVRNTYRNGERNALQYERALRYSGTAEYARRWIAFRRSEAGQCARHFSRVPSSFYQFFEPDSSAGLAIIYNADGSLPGPQVLFAVNPEGRDLRLDLGDHANGWRQLADHERFWGDNDALVQQDVSEGLYLPPLGLGLWSRNK